MREISSLIQFLQAYRSSQIHLSDNQLGPIEEILLVCLIWQQVRISF